MSDATATILFAGGGTGGHLFPSIAIAERLPTHPPAEGEPPAPAIAAHFVCSDRQIDAAILSQAGVAFTPIPQLPLPRRITAIPRFIASYVRSRRAAGRLMRSLNVRAVVAMGGFVSAPVIAAARRHRVPVMMVNLDAVPGIANRRLAGRCDRLFSVYPTTALGRPAERVSMPLRRVSVFEGEHADARRAMGLNPERPVLFVTGASQGAESLNQMMIELVNRVPMQAMLARWQVLHLAGPGRGEQVAAAYEDAGVRHKVLDFCDTMGVAWGSADLAISRAGAGSVAEAVANAVPCVFLPYPHHKDQHQKLNAVPIVEQAGAILFDDHDDPIANADRLQFPIMQMMDDPDRLERMRQNLRRMQNGNGAERLATEALTLAGLPGPTPSAPGTAAV